MSAYDEILGLKQRVAQSIIGQESVIEQLIIALVANGNVLMEGLPGLAKTRAIKAGSPYKAVQVVKDYVTNRHNLLISLDRSF